MDTAVDDRTPARSRYGNLLALLGVLVAGLVVALLPASPDPLDVDAPPELFSAGRAAEHIDTIAGSPRVPGSPAHTAARDRLISALDALGWDTGIESGVGWAAWPQEPTQRGGRVHNVVAVRPGTDPTGTVVLAAHYDTVRGSPGAADDGLGVGVVLEVARAIDAGPPPRNDVLVLLTDGEESGLLGAQLFAASDRPRDGPVVVLNHEARGNSGVPTTFRTTSPDGALVDTLARSPGANADSLTESVFELLPNDTDFRRFDEAGFHAYDTAISSGAAYYHSPLDTPDRLDRKSLQHMGETTLVTARDLAGADLTTLDDAGNEVVTTAPWGLLHAPRWVEIAGAVLLAAMVAGTCVLRIRRGEASPAGIGVAVGVSLLAALGAAAAAWLPWWIVQTLAPGTAAPVVDEPYHPSLFRLAAVAAAVGVLVTVWAWWVRGRRPGSFTCGAFVLVALLALAGVPFTGVAATILVTVLPTVLGVLAGLLLRGDGPGRLLATTLGALVSAVFAVPAVFVTFDAGLLYGAPLAGLFTGLVLVAVLPLCEPLRPGRHGARVSAVAALVVVLVCTLVAGHLNRDGATDPRQEYLWYSLDADSGVATWASPDGPRSEWSRALLPDGPTPLPDGFPWRPDTAMHHGPAPVADLEAPRVEVLSDETGGSTRALRLRLIPAGDSQLIGLWVNGDTARVHGATVEGVRAEPSERFGFLFWAPGPEGVEVDLTLGMRDRELELRVADLSDDPSVVPGYEPPTDRVVLQPTVAVTRSLRL